MTLPLPGATPEPDGVAGETYGAALVASDGATRDAVVGVLRDIRFTGWIAPPDGGWIVAIGDPGDGTVAADRRGVLEVAAVLADRLGTTAFAVRCAGTASSCSPRGTDRGTRPVLERPVGRAGRRRAGARRTARRRPCRRLRRSRPDARTRPRNSRTCSPRSSIPTACSNPNARARARTARDATLAGRVGVAAARHPDGAGRARGGPARGGRAGCDGPAPRPCGGRGAASDGTSARDRGAATLRRPRHRSLAPVMRRWEGATRAIGSGREARPGIASPAPAGPTPHLEVTVSMTLDELPAVAECSVMGCSYNDHSHCHAAAVTIAGSVGDAEVRDVHPAGHEGRARQGDQPRRRVPALGVRAQRLARVHRRVGAGGPRRRRRRLPHLRTALTRAFCCERRALSCGASVA